MALSMFKDKAFPTESTLIKFGQSVCMVKNPERILENIQEMKLEVMRDCAARMDDELIRKLKRAWGLVITEQD